jgi:hypothetical protein
VLPPRIQETGLRMPTHRKRLATIQHPRPVHPLVDLGRQILNFRVRKVLPRRQHPTQEEGSVDRRDLALPLPLPGVHVDKVVIEAMLMRKFLPQKPQSSSHPLDDLGFLPVAARLADAKPRQPKPGRRDAGNRMRVLALRLRAIFHLARRASLVPEKLKRGSVRSHPAARRPNRGKGPLQAR